MSRLRRVAPCALFAMFFVSICALVPVSASGSMPLGLLCGGAAFASFVALAGWVYVHSRPLGASQAERPGPEARSEGTILRRRWMWRVRAPWSGGVPWRRKQRWEAFERDFWSYLHESAEAPRWSGGSHPPS